MEEILKEFSQFLDKVVDVPVVTWVVVPVVQDDAVHCVAERIVVFSATDHGEIVKVIQLVRTARCLCCAGRAGFSGAGCDSCDPTVAAR